MYKITRVESGEIFCEDKDRERIADTLSTLGVNVEFEKVKNKIKRCANITCLREWKPNKEDKCSYCGSRRFSYKSVPQLMTENIVMNNKMLGIRTKPLLWRCPICDEDNSIATEKLLVCEKCKEEIEREAFKKFLDR